MITDARMIDLAERVADGYSNATDDSIRELAVFALAMVADRDLERQGRHAAETHVKQLMLDAVSRQSLTVVDKYEPEWLSILRASGAL